MQRCVLLAVECPKIHFRLVPIGTCYGCELCKKVSRRHDMVECKWEKPKEAQP